MCKVTINGLTYLGNNEDSWRIGSFIWFENKTTGNYGSVYVGYGDGMPQGGMNEAGLAFDGLTVSQKNLRINPHKPTIRDASAFIKEIMQTCKSVDDVKKYANQFNRMALNSSVLLFADKYGNYLVMEPDTIIVGNDDKYIIANFCPSATSHTEKLNFERYYRGEKYLLSHANDTNQDFCLRLVDTMHECRRKMGDGTLYSYVADLDKGKFALYFYHDYTHKMEFNLRNELDQGDHKLAIPKLFPLNVEYRRLTAFQTPQNNLKMLLFLYLCGGLFAFSALYFLASSLTNKKRNVNLNSIMLIVALSFVLLYYMYVLIANQAIFYFPSPYHDWKFSILNIAAYVPFLMLILIIPLVTRNIQADKEKSWTLFSKCLLTINSLTYLTLIALFAYWKLYDIF
ncbi:MAG: hypothetical protein ACHQEM_00205 [Chitinophagales bacterium]